MRIALFLGVLLFIKCINPEFQVDFFSYCSLISIVIGLVILDCYEVYLKGTI